MSGRAAGAEPLGRAPIDPLAPAPRGTYADGLVVVEHTSTRPVAGPPRGVRTAHFDVVRERDRLRVRHALRAADVDDDLGGMLARELVQPGWVTGSEMFERIFTGLVLSTHADPLAAWERFYRNTLRRLDALVGPPPAPPRTPPPRGGGPPPPHDPRIPAPLGGGGHGSLRAYAPVYTRAELLVSGHRVLELGSCFGFLSLRLARAGLDVTGSDVAPATVRLLAAVTERLRIPLRCRVADATRVPLPDEYADTVLLVHLLEHLDDQDGERAVTEACRLARRRVVVAVPYEDEPDPAYGHVRTVDADALRAAGARTRWRSSVHDHHGGWLVLDRPT